MKARGILAALAAAMAVWVPSRADAQIATLDKIAERIESIDIYRSNSSFFRSSAQLEPKTGGLGLIGYGVELSFRIASISDAAAAPLKPDTTRSPATGRQSKRPSNSTPASSLRWISKARSDSVTLSEIEVKIAGKDTTTTFKFAPARASDSPATSIGLELALGYGEIGRFRLKDRSVDLEASVWELPAVSVYATYKPDGVASPYLGLRSGLAQLHNAHFFESRVDSTRDSFKVECSVFQLGVAGGLSLDVGDILARAVSHLKIPTRFAPKPHAVVGFVEYSVTSRKFRGLDYGAKLPIGAPRSLEFTTQDLSIGLQFDLGGKKKDG